MQGETTRSMICSISFPFLAGVLMASLKIPVTFIGWPVAEDAREVVVVEEDEGAFSAMESSACEL